MLLIYFGFDGRLELLLHTSGHSIVETSKTLPRPLHCSCLWSCPNIWSILLPLLWWRYFVSAEYIMNLSICSSSSYCIIWLVCITLSVIVPFDPLAKFEVVLISGFGELFNLNDFLDIIIFECVL